MGTGDEDRPVWTPGGDLGEPGGRDPSVAGGITPGPAGSSPGPEQAPDAPSDPGRRRLIVGGAALIGGAALAGGLGKFVIDQLTGAPAPAASPGPPTPPPSPLAAASTVMPLAPGEELAAPGITPLVTPAAEFFRVDTTPSIPRVDAATWQLKISGMVDRPRTWSYSDLLAMPLFEQYVTLACVSNSVGGNLIGNALWTGVRLKQLLADAGVQDGATQIVGRSVDGFTVGFPTSWALEPSREPMVALGMNRGPLPPEHGHPARLIVPGLYGYVSATKWLSEIELTTEEKFLAYWVQLGWDRFAPILTEARIDHPAYLARIPAGQTWVDGVAWATDVGISRVEVRIDDGPWNQAQLSRAISKATWVQWMWQWEATPGSHRIWVRATDGTGQVQTDAQSQPFPNAATGYPSIDVTVT